VWPAVVVIISALVFIAYAALSEMHERIYRLEERIKTGNEFLKQIAEAVERINHREWQRDADREARKYPSYVDD
jgi:hypothetical protein